MGEKWEGHRERLRRRAELEGFDLLREEHLVELLLFHAVPRIDVSKQAKALVDRFDTLHNILAASREALMETPGVTRSMADWIQMTAELMHAYEQVDHLSPCRIWRYRDIANYLSPFWRDVHGPCCWMLYTDFEGRLLMQSEICQSLNWADSQYASDILRESLCIQAKNTFLVLFTGGEALDFAAWESDYLIALSRSLRAIGVELLDCVVVEETGMFSMNLEGRMERVVRESPQIKLHEHYRGQSNFKWPPEEG